MVPRQSGFTVLELIVGLAVAGFVAVSVHALYAAVADSGHAVARAARAADARANQEHFLRGLIHGAPGGGEHGRYFEGYRDRASFSSWCPVGAGWLERCGVDLALQDSLTVSWTTGAARSTEQLSWPANPRHLIYLSDAGGGGRWFERWGTGLRIPLAIGIVTTTDTVVIRIGML